MLKHVVFTLFRIRYPLIAPSLLTRPFDKLTAYTYRIPSLQIPLNFTRSRSRSTNNTNKNTTTMSAETESERRTLGKSEHVDIKEVARQKWLALNIITYKDPNGKERVWECVSRTTTPKNSVADAVGMIAVFHDPVQDCKCVILIRQYRPPMQTYTIEFPAGLIDKGETPEQAAIREMKEETGYDVTVSAVSPGTALDPGVGSSKLVIVKCEVNVSNIGQDYPKPHAVDDDEFVETVVVPLSTLNSKLEEFNERGYIVDSRVYSWAMGLGL